MTSATPDTTQQHKHNNSKLFRINQLSQP